MPTTVNEQSVDGVNINNLKAATDMSIIAMHTASQNVVANQQHVQSIVNAALQNGLMLGQNMLQSGMLLGQAVTTQGVKRLLDMSIEQAVSDTKLLGADLQDKLSNLGSALSAVQQDIKAAQTTPPQTGTGGAFGSDSGSALAQQIANAVSLAITEALGKTVVTAK
jgi:hypothetical protein